MFKDYNKVPKTGWYKTTEIHSPIVLDDRSLKLRGWPGYFLLEGSEWESVSWLFLTFWCYWKSLVLLGLQLRNSNLYLHCRMSIFPLWVCVFTWWSPCPVCLSLCIFSSSYRNTSQVLIKVPSYSSRISSELTSSLYLQRLYSSPHLTTVSLSVTYSQLCSKNIK